MNMNEAGSILMSAYVHLYSNAFPQTYIAIMCDKIMFGYWLQKERLPKIHEYRYDHNFVYHMSTFGDVIKINFISGSQTGI